MIPGLLRSIWLTTLFVVACLEALPTQAATYYISPSGSDTNPGTSVKPWLTFSYAINPARAHCGDTLVLLDGIYGDGTSTGKINLNNMICTKGNEFIISAQNQRKAKIVDDGTAVAVKGQGIAYVVFDGLYATSTDNPSSTGDRGRPFEIRDANHITIKNSLAKNPNRYANTTAIGFLFSQDILVEDNEVYVFHRHCTAAVAVERMVVRRQYCNPRGGRIPGGWSAVGAPSGSGDAVFSMYPCKDCILENSIADGTTHGMFLNEMNATFNGNVLMSGSKILGSICYRCSYANGIYLNPRKLADLNHTPQNITIRDVAFIDFNSKAAAIRCSDCVNVTVDRVTVLGGGSGVSGVRADNTLFGSEPSTNSIIMTNVLVSGLTGAGFLVTGYNTWNGDRLFSNGNRTAFDPALPSNWTNTSAKAHGMGTCKVWVPAGAAVKGAGTSGSDIGANILYRYINGTLTSIPLWDPRTGEFPHGQPDLDGTNRLAGESLFDIHTRLNVNTGGCSFPIDYGNGDSDTKKPASPIGLSVSN